MSIVGEFEFSFLMFHLGEDFEVSSKHDNYYSIEFLTMEKHLVFNYTCLYTLDFER